MKEVGRVQFSIGRSMTRNQQWRGTEQAHAAMMAILEESEKRWLASSQDIDCRRFACTNTLIALASFVKKMGISDFGQDRLDELIWSFAKANWGQSTPLLRRAKMHPGRLSPVDRMYQGAAQACVDLYTGARLPVGEARTRTARIFHSKGIKGLGVETLAKLGSRLSGKNARSDPNYDYYRMALDFGRYELKRRGGAWPPSESQAENVVKALIRVTINEDKAPK